MNTLSTDRQAQSLRALVQGNSLRASARMTGTAKRTVSNLLREVGAHCKNFHDRFVTGLPCKDIQVDEIWSFVGCKEKRVPEAEKGRGERGDVWTFTALDRDTKLMVAYRIGSRSAETATPFMEDLADRLGTRVQLTTDGLSVYLRSVEEASGGATWTTPCS